MNSLRTSSTSPSPSTTTPRRCPRLAAFFYAQALEERNHALMMVQFLSTRTSRRSCRASTAPQVRFGDVVSPVALALEQEKRVSEQINALAALAREHGDYTSEQFMQWFIKEQIEEVATMSDLLRVVERAARQPAAGRGVPRARVARRRGRGPDRPARRRRLASRPGSRPRCAGRSRTWCAASCRCGRRRACAGAACRSRRRSGCGR